MTQERADRMYDEMMRMSTLGMIKEVVVEQLIIMCDEDEDVEDTEHCTYCTCTHNHGQELIGCRWICPSCHKEITPDE